MLTEYLDTLGLMFSTIYSALPWILFVPVIIVNFYGWWTLSLSVFSYWVLGQNSFEIREGLSLGAILGPLLSLFGTVPLFIMILN